MANKIVSAKIRRINDHFYQVESASGHRDYTVNPITRVCTCPDAMYRGNKNCKHLLAVEELIAAEIKPTALETAAAKAASLTDEELRHHAAQRNGTAAGCACLLELAQRRLATQTAEAPTVDVLAGRCTCREFTERYAGKRIGVLFVTCQHLDAARKAVFA